MHAWHDRECKALVRRPPCLRRQLNELGQTKGAAASAAAAAAANAPPVAAASAAGALSLTPVAAEGLSVEDDGNRAKRTIKIKALIGAGCL